MAPSRNTIGDSIGNAEIIDLVSSEDEKDESVLATTVASGKRRRRDVSSPENRRAAKKKPPSTQHTQQQQQSTTCMPFITGNVLDHAACTCDLMPLLHRLTSPDILFCTGRQPSNTPTSSCVLHIRQTDMWSCGFRSLQVLLTAVLPLLPQHHAFYSKIPTSLGSFYSPPSLQHRPVPIPSLHDLQVFLQKSWNEGFDPRGAQHYSHTIVGKCAEIGAVEVSTILSYLHLDSSVVQFIKISKSRNMLGPFVWQYFLNGSCFQCGHVATSCTNEALRLLQAVSQQQQQHAASRNINDDTCACPLVPLYLQWQGHAVCIVGIERKVDDYDLLLFDPMKRGEGLKTSLERMGKRDGLKPMRMSCQKFAKRDFQILMCSPRELSMEERSAISNPHQGGGGTGNVVTAAATAVMQFRQEQQQR